MHSSLPFLYLFHELTNLFVTFYLRFCAEADRFCAKVVLQKDDSHSLALYEGFVSSIAAVVRKLIFITLLD